MQPPTQIAAAAANVSPQGSIHRRREATRPLAIGSANVLVMNKELVEIRQGADPSDAEEPDGRAGPDPRDEPREVLALGQSGPTPLGEPLEGTRQTRQGPATRSCSRNTRWAARSWVVQPSISVGTEGPSSSKRSHSARRSCVSSGTSAMPPQSTSAKGGSGPYDARILASGEAHPQVLIIARAKVDRWMAACQILGCAPQFSADHCRSRPRSLG